MQDILGYTLEQALAALESAAQGIPVEVVESDGYRDSDARQNVSEIRVIGVKASEDRIVLITARF